MNQSQSQTTQQLLLASYSSQAGAFDELRGQDGVMRPHWRQYAQTIEALGSAELITRSDQMRALIEDDGISYNVYGNARDASRAWSVDPIPQILSELEWANLEAGIKQRALLLDHILRDMYGPQRLLRERHIPPEFVFANPGFLRPCHGISLQNRPMLPLYAGDLARGVDGAWMIVADRTQAPSGPGYALENRLVTTRIFPNITQDCGVQRLAGFFERLRTTLREMATSNRDNPAIVLLSPGPTHETYFEHTYLARYLGFTLVEDEDLTVRDNCVYLKTLEGLARVDVILRRVDDFLCDPLEFGADTASGLVGLMQAVHAGNVAVANALGSGVLEAPSLRALLPALCKEVMGEELRLPSVRTWWCANADDLSYVSAHFNELLIAPAFGGRGWNPVVVESLSNAGRAALLESVRARPFEYVAQERVRPSTVPALAGNTVAPRHLMIRSYAVSTLSDTYAVMAGGLTRFSEAPDSLVISMRRGGGSKDTWVLTSGPVDSHTLLPPPGQRIDIKRTVTNLPSRAADNLYWLGRYLERAEFIIRTLRCVLGRLTEEYGVASGRELSAVVRSLTLVLPQRHGQVWIQQELDGASIERHVASALFDPSWTNSVSALFNTLNHSAWFVRDRLSTDTWRVLSRLVEELPDHAALPPLPGNLMAALNQLIKGLAAFSGLAFENMTRGQGWRFLDIGRRVERSLNVFELLRSGLVLPFDPESAVLLAALEISDSSMTYRSRYSNNLQTPAVLDLLLTDESNPRSVAFQVARLARHIDALPRERSYPFASREQQFITRLSADLRLVDIFELATVRIPGRRTVIEARLMEWSQTLRDISDALAWHYFSHTEFSRQVIAFGGETRK